MVKRAKKAPQQNPKGRTGPIAERLVLAGSWKDAVGTALQRGKPTKQKATKKKRRSK